MSNKSGVAPQVISLPQGGGALQGLGEKFSPDLHTGTGNLSVPIALPAGRNGFQPQLNLIYSTGQGNGPFGLGWDLSVPGVSRKTSKGVPRYLDQEDIFVLSGVEDLVPVDTGDTGVTRYQPRTEGLFARIEHYGEIDSGPSHWEVRSKDGFVNFYGSVPGLISEPAIVADPTDSTRIFAWKLTRTVDPVGNRIDYIYGRDDIRTDGPHLWDQLYLSQIRYADYGDPANPKFLVTVDFEYEKRPDPFSEHRAGFEIRTIKRCRRIFVSVHASKSEVTRSYHLTYLDQRNAPFGELPVNGVSLLSQIQMEGHDGGDSEWAPPLEFGYTTFDPTFKEYQPFTAVNNAIPERSLAHSEFELVDLFGSGLPDVIHMNGTVRYWRNLGNGLFDRPREMANAPASVHLNESGVQLGDLNGDGRADLLVTDQFRGGYFPLTFDGAWDPRGFISYRHLPAVNFEDPEVKLIDIDGDGVIDALRTGANLELYYNNPEEGWVDVEARQRSNLEQFPNVQFSDPRVKICDLTGDGLQDIALINSGRIDYWPALGYGRWGQRVTMERSPRFPDELLYGGIGFDPKRALLGDVDGDGLADLVYVESGQITVWINQNGNGWSDPVTVHGTPPITDLDAVRLADMHGTGTSGILWTYDFGAYLDSTYKFLDLTGATKPYLLNKVDNHMGALTRIEYAPSTKFYTEDQRNPETCWKTSLPFPVQVVSRTETIDFFSRVKLTTEYRYHHGYWDGHEREFRGFGRVDQRDTESFEAYLDPGLHPSFQPAIRKAQFSPPLETRTWFHLGSTNDRQHEPEGFDFNREYSVHDSSMFVRPVADSSWLNDLSVAGRRNAIRSMRGQTLRIELYALDGSDREHLPYTVTEHVFGIRQEHAPNTDETEDHYVFYPYLLVERVTQWERGDDPLHQIVFTDVYDAFGQPRAKTTVALPRRSIRCKPVTGAVVGPVDANEKHILATHTRTDYAEPDEDIYMHDRVSQFRTLELLDVSAVYEGAPENLNLVLTEQAMAAQNIHARFIDVFNSWSAGYPLPNEVRINGHMMHHYDGEAFVGRPAGQLGPHGVLSRSEVLVFTDTVLDSAYGDRRPEYLGGPRKPPDGLPAEFGSQLGYRLEPDTLEGHHAGYYVDLKRHRFDTQVPDASEHRGVILGIQDTLGHQSDIELERFWLFPGRIVDPHRLETTAKYNYRVMEPSLVMDPNGNSTEYRFTPLGFVSKIFARARSGEGGTEDKPETEFFYDVLAFHNTRNQVFPKPIFVQTRKRIYHASENFSDASIQLREYSDGYGRLIQVRTQAESLVFGADGNDPGLLVDGKPVPGAIGGPAIGQCQSERVVVTGWQIYDNKGRLVEKYEPFFAVGWDFQDEKEARQGLATRLSYDPRGQLIRTTNPDGSEQRLIFGCLDELTNLDRISPSPWEVHTYDPNDLASLTFDPHMERPNEQLTPLTDRAPIDHQYTPTSTFFDAFGRKIAYVERNGSQSADECFLMRTTYDVRGNILSVTDKLGRLAFQRSYDLLNRQLCVRSIDAGWHTSIPDAVDNDVEYRDDKGAIVVRMYDALNRQTQVWARDSASTSITMRQRLEYGDQDVQGRDANRQFNRLGRLSRHFDEAGVVDFGSYDFKGNLIDKSRRVIADEALANGWVSDWSISGGDDALDPTEYKTTAQFDALNRPVAITYPSQAADLNGHRGVLKPSYNWAGVLERVELDGDTYIGHIAYNARGQRILVTLGNGIMTRYAYDPRSFRLKRLRSERFQELNASCNEWHGIGAPLQDLTFEYDLVGNIVSIEERTPGCGVDGTADGRDRLVRQFKYDPVYRLIGATGRSCKSITASRPFDHPVRCGAYAPPFASNLPAPTQDNGPDVTERYTASYSYDPQGNLLEQVYEATSTVWRRRFGIGGLTPDEWRVAPNNRLTELTLGNERHCFEFDSNGNLVKQNTERHFGWDHADHLIAFRIQPEGATQPSLEARYLYGADGARIKKWLRTNGTGQGESIVYIDGIFEHQRWKKPGKAEGELNRLHVLDGKRRVAVLSVGQLRDVDSGPPLQYHLEDHLGSSSIVIGENGKWVNHEEYFPFGETSFGSFASKRYRFMGKEKDEESGLSLHGARYYASVIARWLSCDPAGPVDGPNLYEFARSNPIALMDPSGHQAEPGATEPVAKINQVEPVVTGPHLQATASDESPPEGIVGNTIFPNDSHAADFTQHLFETLLSGAEQLPDYFEDVQPNFPAPTGVLITLPIGVYDLANPKSDVATRAKGLLGVVQGFSSVASKAAESMGSTAAARGFGVVAAGAAPIATAAEVAYRIRKTYLDAQGSILNNGFRGGVAVGIAAGLMGKDLSWTKSNFWDRTMTSDTATTVVGGQGLRRDFWNAGLVEGYNLVQGLTAEERGALLTRVFETLAKQGYSVPNEASLFSAPTVIRMGSVMSGYLQPTR